MDILPSAFCSFFRLCSFVPGTLTCAVFPSGDIVVHTLCADDLPLCAIGLHISPSIGHYTGIMAFGRYTTCGLCFLPLCSFVPGTVYACRLLTCAVLSVATELILKQNQHNNEVFRRCNCIQVWGKLNGITVE